MSYQGHGNNDNGHGRYESYREQGYSGGQQSYGGSYDYSDAEQGQGGYEMTSVQNGQSGPTTILNKCKEINDGIQDLKAKREGKLAVAQNALLDSSTGKEDQSARQNLDYIEDDINTTFRYLRDLLKKIKQTPGSGDSRVQTQINVTSRNLQREIELYQKAQSEFQRKLRDQVRRRYEIANPNATPEQIDQGIQNVLLGQEQTFQVSGNRTRQANDAKQAAIERSAAIRKIEQDMIELSRLYQEVAELVQQQDHAVEQINQGAEDVVDNVNNANKQIDSAIESARKARKWKWILLLVTILIIIIVIAIAVGVVMANRNK